MANTKKTEDTAPEKKTFRRKRKLVAPLLNAKMQVGQTVYFKITGELYVGKLQKDAKEGEKPADLVRAINLETGEEGDIMVPAVLKSVLEKEFENASYVGCSFSMTKKEKPEGKRYYQYEIDELETD